MHRVTIRTLELRGRENLEPVQTPLEKLWFDPQRAGVGWCSQTGTSLLLGGK